MVTRHYQTPTAQWYDLPLIGDDLAKIGRVINLYAEPCKPTAEIWVYGFFQAIPTLFISLTKPELVDINIKKGGHRPRRGRKARFRANALFRDAIIEIPVPRWVVFRVYEWTQRIGWYFLVADALEDFAINWISMAYIYNGCQSPSLAYLDASTMNKLGGGVFANTWHRWTWDLNTISNFDFPNNQALPALPGTYNVEWNASFRPYPIPSQSQLPYSTRLVITGADPIPGEVSHYGTQEAFASGSGRFYWDGGLPRPNIQINAIQLDTAKFYRVTSQWSIYRTEDNELSPDP